MNKVCPLCPEAGRTQLVLGQFRFSHWYKANLPATAHPRATTEPRLGCSRPTPWPWHPCEGGGPQLQQHNCPGREDHRRWTPPKAWPSLLLRARAPRPTAQPDCQQRGLRACKTKHNRPHAQEPPVTRRVLPSPSRGTGMRGTCGGGRAPRGFHACHSFAQQEGLCRSETPPAEGPATLARKVAPQVPCGPPSRRSACTPQGRGPVGSAQPQRPGAPTRHGCPPPSSEGYCHFNICSYLADKI